MENLVPSGDARSYRPPCLHLPIPSLSFCPARPLTHYSGSFMSLPYIQANTNGRLHSAAEPSITPLNRGFLYGDAIYEVWRTYQGVIFAWEEHWARLERSAKALYLELPFDRDRILLEIRRTTAAFVLIVQPCPLLSPEKLESGLTLSLAQGLRRNPIDALNPAWKTGNYLNNLLCLREAKSRGADEVLILNGAGHLTEAAVCNVGFVRGGEVITPPLEAGILEGITRGLLISTIARRLGVRVREEFLTVRDLDGVEECFLLSSTKDLAPVASLDGRAFRLGPDTLTRRLKKGFEAYAADYAASHASMTV